MQPSPASGLQAVVIGVGPGLGRSLALAFARHGLDVGLVARRPEVLESVAGEIRSIGRTARTAPADAADADRLAGAVGALAEAAPIQVLAYNAMLAGGGLAGADLDLLRRASEVNLLSAVRAVQAALPDLERTGGTVLLTGGGLSLHPVGALGVLSAGKAALRAAAFALAEELEPRGVKVRTVTVAGRIEPGTDLDPDRIAEVFWDAHATPSSPVEVVLPR